MSLRFEIFGLLLFLNFGEQLPIPVLQRSLPKMFLDVFFDKNSRFSYFFRLSKLEDSYLAPFLRNHVNDEDNTDVQNLWCLFNHTIHKRARVYRKTI